MIAAEKAAQYLDHIMLFYYRMMMNVKARQYNSMDVFF